MEHGWVALLRAINLGPRNRVPMAGLRRVYEEAGCGAVSTYIASGNVLFTSRSGDRTRLARKLERAVEDAFGVAATVVLRRFEELLAVREAHPFGADTSRTHVVFLACEPEPAAVRRLVGLDVAPDEVVVVGSEVFVRYPEGVQGARLGGALLERTLGVAGTMRNWKTVAKLAELAGGDPVR
jgi:uncharacterized protein (DUF1697 family)